MTEKHCNELDSGKIKCSGLVITSGFGSSRVRWYCPQNSDFFDKKNCKSGLLTKGKLKLKFNLDQTNQRLF